MSRQSPGVSALRILVISRGFTMPSSADRNLLFGILALQMDFISRDQLVEAMNAWVLHKDRPLGDLLVECGALAADDEALLASMVERHIARHGGDAARSLAVLSSVAPVP